MTPTAFKTRYSGKILATSPSNDLEDDEHQTILAVSHTLDLIIGIQFNHIIPEHTLQHVSAKIGIDLPGLDPLWFGGPRSQDKIHVIHSTDWMGTSSVTITPDIAVTNDISILAAISEGEGPTDYRACAGFWSWPTDDFVKSMSNRRFRNSQGIIRNPLSWEPVPATPELIFGLQAGATQWQRVLTASAEHQAAKFF